MPEQTYSTRLTLAQRKAIAELMPAISERLLLGTKNQRSIPLTIAELSQIQALAGESIKDADTEMKRNSLRHVIVAVANTIEESNGVRSIRLAERLYQFKITLCESDPVIWRRIQVKECSLERLHEHIQLAMGWTNSHLHQFEIGSERFGNPEYLDDSCEGFHCVDAAATKLDDIMPKDGSRFSFKYEYDFGDSWHHEVLFEGCLQSVNGKRYPVCVEGERACPPEDVAGVWGYADFLEAIGDPRHEQYNDFMEWAGPFDSEYFDSKKTTKLMQRGLPKLQS